MNLLDKVILLEANSVSDADYKQMTGHSIEELRARIKQHVEETMRKGAGNVPSSKYRRWNRQDDIGSRSVAGREFFLPWHD